MRVPSCMRASPSICSASRLGFVAERLDAILNEAGYHQDAQAVEPEQNISTAWSVRAAKASLSTRNG